MLLKKIYSDRRVPYRIRPIWDKPKLITTRWYKPGIHTIKRFADGNEYIVFAIHFIPKIDHIFGGFRWVGIGLRLPFAQELV